VTFNDTLIFARNRQMVSSWKLESSSTFHCCGREESIMAVTEYRYCRRPAPEFPTPRMWPASAVVVVLPFDPVMPMTGPSRK
jgi:hypothetical protein